MITNEKQTNITLTTKKKIINPSFYQHQLLHKFLDLWRVGLLPLAVVGVVPLCLCKDGKKMKNLEIETLGFRVVIYDCCWLCCCLFMLGESANTFIFSWKRRGCLFKVRV